MIFGTALVLYKSANYKQELFLPERGYQEFFRVSGFDRDSPRVLELDQLSEILRREYSKGD